MHNLFATRKTDLQQAIADSITSSVETALAEDLGMGDISAQLIDQQKTAKAVIVSRESAIFCGKQWADETFHQLDSTLDIKWQVNDGDAIVPDQTLATLTGNARHLLSAERTALNYLQTLSATATISRQYATLVEASSVVILDTRKTLPGLRLAQKYAVQCGGCQNHRLGLYDAYLIKENHITCCGGVAQAVSKARHLQPNKIVELEVENESQLIEALSSKVDIIMLDNFDNDAISRAVEQRDQLNPESKLEVSGNIDLQRLIEIRNMGIDYVSIGGLTKHCKSIDLSMLLI